MVGDGMNDEKGIVIIAAILLFAFFAFLFPQIANAFYASSTTSYAKPFLLAMVSVLAVSFVYFLYKVIEHG